MNTENLKDLADAKFKHALFRKNLRERIEAQLVVAHNGGLFKATPELIAFLWMWHDNDMVIEDAYHNPIEVDRVGLLILAREHYQKVMNRWHQEHNELKRLRKI